jgi:hypothetical protein
MSIIHAFLLYLSPDLSLARAAENAIRGRDMTTF